MATNHYFEDVPSLQSLALDAFFEKVLYKVTPETVDFVRDTLDNHLIGKVKKDVRESCAEKFYEMYHEQPEMMESEYYEHQKDIKDIFVVMDCLLDEHFKSLKVCVPFPALKSFSALMAIIAHRCPGLEDLTVSFRHNFKETFSSRKNRKAKKEKSLYSIQPGSSLSALKSLTLDLNDPTGPPFHHVRETRDSLLGIVGKLCPVLTKLEVGGVCTNKMDVVALILNPDMADILFPKDENRFIKNSAFSGLRIPIEFLNPLCSTLRELILDRWRWRDCDCISPVSTFAFALRHLSKLEYAELEVPTIEVVKLLYKVGFVDQKPFEKAWRKAASSIGLDVSSPTFFSAMLSLKKLDWVPINDSCSLLAVSFLCQSELEEVGFEDGGDDSSGSDSSEEDSDIDDDDEESSSSSSPSSPEKMSDDGDKSDDEGESIEDESYGMTDDPEIILKAWPKKIETVKVSLYNPDFLKMILDIFGPNLKKLEFKSSCTIDMDYLASVCTKLEQLTIDCSTVIMIDSDEAASRWTPETFLPKLTHFISNSLFTSCLGFWSLLIEKKSTLVRLSLDCCHIGTNANSPRLEWSQLPELWPQLESLEIRNCTGLTMAMVAELIPRFSKLRRVGLPSSLLARNRSLARKIMEDFLGREEPVEIEDCPSLIGILCSFHSPNAN